MNLLSVDGLTAKAGAELLFEGISFGIDEGDKIGLVGDNGCGKSTLLRLLIGSRQPDSGNVVANRNLRISYLEQNPAAEGTSTIRDYFYSGDSPLVNLILEYEENCRLLREGADERTHLRHEELTSEMERSGAWSYESDVRSILHQLRIFDLHMEMSALSGGMMKKVALARALIADSNLLILDEPTNHLDIDTVIWLENHLVKTRKSLLLVTHDRYFLERVTGRIYEIDNGALYIYDGSYSRYLEKKDEREALEKRIEERARGLLRRELEWLKRQPKARGGKAKARVDRIEAVRSRPRPEKSRDFEFHSDSARSGKKILEVRNIGKSFGGHNLFSGFTHSFKPDERIGIVGPNGSGKSTLLGILGGRLEPDSGGLSVGVNTRFGYFDQSGELLDPERRVLEFVRREAGENVRTRGGELISASLFLDQFGFGSRQQHQKIARLSGGERRRLQLVFVLLTGPNFLMLDEPTNDLDVRTLGVLEAFLDRFAGCLLVVSHDRFFMNRVVDSLLVLDGRGAIVKVPGDYERYLESSKEVEAAGDDATTSAVAGQRAAGRSAAGRIPAERSTSDRESKLKAPARKKTAAKKGDSGKLSYIAAREFRALEKEIAELESRRDRLKSEILAARGDYREQGTRGEEFNEVESLLEKKLERWLELAEESEGSR